MNPYTVVGYYRDNKQPWTQHVEADSPRHAAIRGVQKIWEGGSNVQENDIVVVDVIEGHHTSVLDNDWVLRADRDLNLKAPDPCKECMHTADHCNTCEKG